MAWRLTSDVDLCNTGSVGLKVAQVTNVPYVSIGGTVGLAKGVEVRSSRSASVGVVTELAVRMIQGWSVRLIQTDEHSCNVLDVESSLGVGVHVLEFSRDGDGSTRLGLLKEDGTLNGRVSLENSDSLKTQKVVSVRPYMIAEIKVEARPVI